MSGTSADGIDVAIVRIRPRAAGGAQRDSPADLKLDLLHHSAIAFPRALRTAILRAAEGGNHTVAELAHLHWRLGLAYAEAAHVAITASGKRIDLVGCHGQTIYHQGRVGRELGRNFACTWQIGEPAVMVARLGVPVVANFRPADMARGGQGAPLVSLLDFALYRHPKRARVLQNIGGIGNLTCVPAGGSLADVRALDSGPGNMVIDALMQQLYERPYDRGGRVARTGTVLTPVIEGILRDPFYAQAPPKSVGREQYGADFAARFLAGCRRLSANPADAIATATALTVESITVAYERFVRVSVTDSPVDYLVSGGGAKNQALMAMLGDRLTPLGCTVASLGDTSLPVDAKEAAAFALMAYQTWHHRPGNVPSATGASGPAILGQVCYA